MFSQSGYLQKVWCHLLYTEPISGRKQFTLVSCTNQLQVWGNNGRVALDSHLFSVKEQFQEIPFNLLWKSSSNLLLLKFQPSSTERKSVALKFGGDSSEHSQMNEYLCKHKPISASWCHRVFLWAEAMPTNFYHCCTCFKQHYTACLRATEFVSFTGVVIITTFGFAAFNCLLAPSWHPWRCKWVNKYQACVSLTTSLLFQLYETFD